MEGREMYDQDEIEVLYGLNDFRTFTDQHHWFFDKSSNEYYEYVNGAILSNWLNRDGYYQSDGPAVEDVIFADDIYRALFLMRQETLKIIEPLSEESITSTGDEDILAQIDHINTMLNDWKIWDAHQSAVKLSAQLSDIEG